jgi:hypothetical protein
LESIKQEIIEELTQDAEDYILKECGQKYNEIINNGYFKIEDREVEKHENEVVPDR